MSDEENTSSEESASVDDQALADEWAAALAESGASDAEQDEIDAMLEQQSEQKEVEHTKAPMEEFDGSPEPSESLTSVDGPNLDVILDIPVSISMEVGSADISIRNLLQLNQGSVVELDRLAGEPLDVMVNGTLIAHGEVVVVNEKFGIRLTDVISPSERIKKLR